MARSGSTAIFFAGLPTTGSRTWSSNPTIRSIGAVISPVNRQIFASAVNANTLGRVDAFLSTSNTNLQWMSGGVGTGWISLENIIYSRATQTLAPLTNGWANYGSTYAPASSALDGGAVYVAGLIKHTAFPLNRAAFILPAGSRPQNREIFPALSNNKYGRVDVLPQGNVSVITASGTSGWVSLSNIHFRPSGSVFTNAVMSSGWVTYSGYAPFSSNLGADDRVFLRGLVRAGSAATIGTLPVGHRPVARRIFLAACSNGPCRVDVPNTGVVTLVGKTPGTTGWPSWVSLSGIAFDATPDAAA